MAAGIEPTAEMDRLTQARRPSGPAIGYHRWRNLTFLHWRLPAATVQPLLPPGLTLDTWDGSAWVGLVPFQMRGIRPWWSPGVPGVSNFLETNVRTYVHYQGRDPGVWFFSLDASSPLAVSVARRLWKLPYYWARMGCTVGAGTCSYWSARRWPHVRPCQSTVRVGVESPVDGGTDGADHSARPGTLEHFLIERYLLYAGSPGGRLLRGQVHHRPYPLRAARVEQCADDLLTASGFTVSTGPEHALFSPGVDVEIFPLRPVT